MIEVCSLIYQPLLNKLDFPMALSHKIRGKSGGPSDDIQGGRAVSPTVRTSMNVNMDSRTSAGSSFDRNVMSGGFRELDNEDQGRLKHRRAS